MKQPELYILEGEEREAGRKSTRALRGEKRVPSVLYGSGIEESIHFSIEELDLERILSVSETKLQELTINGTTYRTLLKKVEYDPVTDRPLHADFYVMNPKKPVKLSVPVNLTGTAKGVRDSGGRVFQPLRIVRVKVLPDRIPAYFELDISDLGIGDSLHVDKLDLDGIDPLDDPSRTIVTIAPPRSDAAFVSSGDEDDLLEDVDEELDEATESEETEEEEATE